MSILEFKSVLLVAVFLVSTAFGGEGARATPILPKQFAGWQIAGTAQSSHDPSAADPVNPALLKEYGFTDFESATYARDDGRKLTVKAARFADASGAYGAFTYYEMPQMLPEKIGDQGVSLNERVLFCRGNVLVDAVLSRVTAMSAAELRELSAALPLPSGGARNLPALSAYLPRQSLLKNSAKYLVGPVGLEKSGAPLPAPIVDFSAGAEVVLGTYRTSDGEATLMLISYPTPQIAAGHLRQIDGARVQQGTTALPPPAHFFDKRSGPIVVVASGPFSESEATSLLAAVNYDASVTWNENTFLSKRDNIGNLVWNALVLCGILMGFALVAGFAFGGFRILVKRLFPERIFDRRGEMEFISLNLTSAPQHPADSSVSSSIKAG